MNLIQRDGHAERWIFQIGKREKNLLIEVLKLYPLIPAAHPGSKPGAANGKTAENRRLLEESLAERKKENQRQLRLLLNEESRFKEVGDGYHFVLRASEIEWLLQVVNDIRVGSWLALGEPDERKGKPIAWTRENARHYAAMEFCGYLQITLLGAIDPAS